MTTIKPEVTDITGMDDYNLVDQSRLDENTAKLIINFLARLTHPICLVPHNANLYDFPLIKAEMDNVRNLKVKFYVQIRTWLSSHSSKEIKINHNLSL